MGPGARLAKGSAAGAGRLIFKGSGFYITDYRSEGYKSAAKKEAPPDAKPAAKTGIQGLNQKRNPRWKSNPPLRRKNPKRNEATAPLRRFIHSVLRGDDMGDGLAPASPVAACAQFSSGPISVHSVSGQFIVVVAGTKSSSLLHEAQYATNATTTIRLDPALLAISA